MKPVPVTIYDGTNTTTVNRINAPAGSVDPNGVLDLGLGVKVYRALLTQTNTDAPVATVLENTLGGEVVWSYNVPGVYLGVLTGAFTANKTGLSPINAVGNLDEVTAYTVTSLRRDDADIIRMQTATADVAGGTLTLGDDLLTNAYVEILVYP